VAGAFTLQTGGSVLTLGEPVPFSMTATINLGNGMTLPSSDWSQFEFTLILSEDETLDESDYHIAYAPTGCQQDMLKSEYSSVSNVITIEDPGTVLHLIPFYQPIHFAKICNTIFPLI